MKEDSLSSTSVSEYISCRNQVISNTLNKNDSDIVRVLILTVLHIVFQLMTNPHHAFFP